MLRKLMRLGPLAGLGLLAGVAACSDRNSGPTAPVRQDTAAFAAFVSNPVQAPGPLVQGAHGFSGVGAAAESVVYVSMAPATVLHGASVAIRNLRTGERRTAPLVEGGLDPVAVGAVVGDTVEIVATDSAGVSTRVLNVVVPRRSPIVVRTQPPKKKTDVPLNASMTVVFSEPVDATTVTSTTVHLVVGDAGGQPVEGALSLSADGLQARFVPAARLLAQTTYTLIITTSVRDWTGDALEAEVAASFTTQPAVATVTVTPPDVSIITGQRVQLLATLRDAAGAPLVGRDVTWSSSTPQVATVDSTGVVTGSAEGTATITATSEGVSGTANVGVVAAGPFVQISAGALHTCAVEFDGAAWCWGHPTDGQLGIGTSLPSRDQVTPAPVQGGLSFRMVHAGSLHTCGITTGGRAYCWGWNFLGNLGDGDVSGDSKYTPVPVAGAFVLTDLDAGLYHNCGVATTGDAFCWGFDHSGELGDGPVEYFGHGSVRVAGGLTFSAVDAGAAYTCAVSSAGAAYCWGENRRGQLGDGSTSWKTEPVAVSGGLTFASLSAGGSHTCGITASGALYCWGRDRYGQLGRGASTTETCTEFVTPTSSETGQYPCSTRPLPVSGGLTFASVSAGDTHTCGISTAGATYCWGDNAYGQFGNGSTNPSSVPEPIAPGFTFTSISAGSNYTCGVTGEGVAYCWGQNHHAQLGDGSYTNRTTPVLVAAQR